MTMQRNKVYELIDSERAYQDAKWGDIEQNPHTVLEWIKIAQEEMNEAFHEESKSRKKSSHATIEDALAELRQVAAVCIAALEQHGCPPRRPL